MDLLKSDDNEILEPIGFVAAIIALSELDGVVGSKREGTGVLVALGDYIGGRPRAGVQSRWIPVAPPGSPRSDDLLLLWLPENLSSGPILVRGAVIEVKYSSEGQADLDRARSQVLRTRGWLDDALNAQGSSRPFRARDLCELIASAVARADTFRLGSPIRAGTADKAIEAIQEGNYELDLTHWRDGKAHAA